MAINPETQYPGKIDPSSPDYPYGEARNVTTPGDGTGTPWEAALVNDIFGFQQALLTAGSVVPSGSPETATASQYLTALKAIFPQAASQSLANIDTVNKTGFYISTVATLGTAPPDGLNGELLHMERGSSNQATQIFDTLRGAGQDQALYTRTKRNDGTWTTWTDLLGAGSGGVGAFTFLSCGDGTPNANSIPGDDPHWFEISNNPGDGAAGNQLFRMNSYGNIAYGNNLHSCRYFGNEGAPTAIQNGAFIMSWGYRGYDGSALSQSAGAFQYEATENWGASAHGSQFAWETTPNGSTTRTRRMVLDPSGNLLVGTTSNTYHALNKTTSQGNPILLISNNTNGSVWYSADGGGANAAAASLRINKNSGTNRSINAAGTINASGADYAEYMRKAEGCGDIAKGALVGIDANGQLTDVFDNAVSFIIKSTDPSYVGGDTWGSEEHLGIKEPVAPTLDEKDLIDAREAAGEKAFAALNAARAALPAQGKDETKESYADRMAPLIAPAVSLYNEALNAAAEEFAQKSEARRTEHDAALEVYAADMGSFKAALEAERQHYDRVAFAGRVPANVQGATPGDHVIPVRAEDGSISAEVTASPSFEQYMASVGKVIAILDDGRPEVIVKVA